MGVHRTWGRAGEIELTAIGVKLNAVGVKLNTRIQGLYRSGKIPVEPL